MKSMRITLAIAILAVSCSDSNPTATLPDDPYLDQISEMAEHFQMPEGFSAEFRAEYLRQVTAEIEGVDKHLSPMDRERQIQRLRSLVFCNLWGEYGVDIQPI